MNPEHDGAPPIRSSFQDALSPAKVAPGTCPFRQLEGGSCRSFAARRRTATDASLSTPNAYGSVQTPVVASPWSHALRVDPDGPSILRPVPEADIDAQASPMASYSTAGLFTPTTQYATSHGLHDGWQYLAVFDVVRHVRILRVSAGTDMQGAISEAIASASHLPGPIAFRIMHYPLPDLPALQLTLWTEPNPGYRVIPVKTGRASYAVCTVNAPVDCPPFELASLVSLACDGNERLRYHVAEGTQILLADGQPTAPFAPGPFAGADCGDAFSVSGEDRLILGPASLAVPRLLTQERFATRSSEVVVHRLGHFTSSVEIPLHFGPQQILTRILSVLGLPGTGRMSCIAVAPVEDPCRLHVVVHPGSKHVMQRVPCLVDLRRVACPPVAGWIVMHMHPTCNRADLQSAIFGQCPTISTAGAIYVNFQLVGERAVGINRNSVITVLGEAPHIDHDVVMAQGSYMPALLRGSDVAALRPGLARFLAAPALQPSTTTTTAGPVAFPSSTATTTAGPVAFPSAGQGGENSTGSGPLQETCTFTVLDALRQVQLRERREEWDPYQCIEDATGTSTVPDPTGRWSRFQIDGLPGPQIIVSSQVRSATHRTIILQCAQCEPQVLVCEYPLGMPLRSFLLAQITRPGHAWGPVIQGNPAFRCQVDGHPAACSQPLDSAVDVVTLTVSEIADTTGFEDTLPISGLPGTVLTLSNVGELSFGPPPSSLGVQSLPSTVVVDEGRFTLFDEFHHMRLMTMPRDAQPQHLVSLAFAHTPQIGHPRGYRFLRRPVPGLPSIQLCIWGAIAPGQVVVPFVIQEPSWPYCTVRVLGSDSAFDASLALEDHCGFDAILHEGLQRRQFHATVNGRYVRPHARNAFQDVDFAGFRLGPVVDVFSATGQEVSVPPVPSVPAQLPVVDSTAVTDAEASLDILVHRPNAPPIHVALPAHLTSHQIADHLAVTTGATEPLQIIWPHVAPLCQGTPSHCVLVAASQVAGTRIAVLDLRRVLCPPTAPFITVEVSSVISFLALLQGLERLVPRCRPITAAYLGSGLLDSCGSLCGPANLITLVSHWQTRGGPNMSAVALFDNAAEAAQRPGVLASLIPASPVPCDTWQSVFPTHSRTTSTSSTPSVWNVWDDSEPELPTDAVASSGVSALVPPHPLGPPTAFGPFPPPIPLVDPAPPDFTDGVFAAIDGAQQVSSASAVFQPWSAWEEAEAESSPVLHVPGPDTRARDHSPTPTDPWQGVHEWVLDSVHTDPWNALGSDDCDPPPALPMGWPVDQNFALHCNDLHALDPRVKPNSFTLFDFALQVRILPKPRFAGEVELRNIARSHCRHLRPPIHIHRLQDEVVGFPSPQFAASAHEFPRRAYALPIDLRPSGWGVCVGLAQVGASLFTLAVDSLHVCPEPALHQKLARGDSVGSMRGTDFDPFVGLPTLPDHVKIRRVAGFQRWGDVPPTESLQQAVSQEATYVADSLELDNVLWVAAHAIGSPSEAFAVDRMVHPDEFARLVSRALGRHCPHQTLELCWPQRHPIGAHALLHVLVDLDHSRPRGHTMFLLDSRGLGAIGDGFCVFSAPSMLTALELLTLCQAHLQGGQPPAYILVNGQLLSETGPRFYSFALIRLVSKEQCDRYESDGRTLEPATLATQAILGQLPAFRILSDTFEGFLQRRCGAFRTPFRDSVSGDAAGVAHSAHDYWGRTTTTSTNTWAGSIAHPCDPLDLATIRFHLSSFRGDMLTSTVRSSDEMQVLLFKFSRSLGRNACLRDGDDFTASPRLYFSARGVHVFLSQCRVGALSWFWILAPEWHTDPILVRCRSQFTRAELFCAARVSDRPEHVATMRGYVWDSSVRPLHGEVLVISTSSHLVRSAPLMSVLHRVPDVQVLLFRQPVPAQSVLADEERHRNYWRVVVRNCQSLFGLHRPGARCTIAAVSAPPMVVCTGALVLPTAARLQDFYDTHLASRFGRCSLRDTTHMDRDNALFVEDWQGSGQSLWIVRMPSGVDIRVADPAGDRLRNLHVGYGWYVQPIVRGDGFGLACITRSTDLADPVRQPTDLGGCQGSSDHIEFQVPAPSGRPLQLTPFFRQFVEDVRMLRDEGLLTTAPATPVAAFEGRPPPPLTESQRYQGRDPIHVPVADFGERFPIFARMLQLVPEVAADGNSAPSDAAAEVPLPLAENGALAGAATATVAPATDGHTAIPDDVSGQDVSDATSLIQVRAQKRESPPLGKLDPTFLRGIATPCRSAAPPTSPFEPDGPLVI